MTQQPDRWAEPEQSAPHFSTEFRPLLSNVVDDWGETKTGKRVQVLWYRPIEEIADSLRQITGDWPRSAGGLLFVAQKKITTDEREIRYLNRPASLYAWIQERCDLRWTNETAQSGANETPRSPATKEELFEHLQASTPKRYIGVSPLPHCPEIPGMYYLPSPALPPDIPLVDGLTGKLEELVQSFNADTEIDRELLRACLLTMAWGGESGTRPAFVLASDYGRASGKTATAEAICSVWGGSFGIEPKEKWEEVAKKLMSDEGLNKRAVLVDNLKGRLSSATFEAAMTRKIIEGHRMYKGYATRPNILTWMFTSNSPKVSEDLACRAVIVHIGKQKHEEAWVDWATVFIREHRQAIIHDCLALLQRPARCTISREYRDRYQAWQDAVLCRSTDRGDEVMEIVMARRGEINADAEDAMEVADAIRADIVARGLDPNRNAVKYAREEMRKLLLKAEVIGAEMGKRAVYTWLSELRGCQPLRNLKDGKGTDRFWVWNPTNSEYVGEIPL